MKSIASKYHLNSSEVPRVGEIVSYCGEPHVIVSKDYFPGETTMSDVVRLNVERLDPRGTLADLGLLGIFS